MGKDTDWNEFNLVFSMRIRTKEKDPDKIDRAFNAALWGENLLPGIPASISDFDIKVTKGDISITTEEELEEIKTAFGKMVDEIRNGYAIGDNYDR